MADALCGPSNALQNFQKHSSVDRTLQQDRLAGRQSPAQGFRSSPGPNAGALDPEFEAFQAGHAGPPHPPFQHLPPYLAHPPPPLPQFAQAPPAPDWAADFQQKLNISSHTSPVQQHRAPASSAASWHTEFMKVQAPAVQVPALQQHSPFAGMSAYGMNGFTGSAFAQRPAVDVMNGAPMSDVAQGKQRAETGPQFDEAAFERAFAEAHQDMLDGAAAEQAKIQEEPELQDFQLKLREVERERQQYLKAAERLVEQMAETDGPALLRIREQRPAVYAALKIRSAIDLGKSADASPYLTILDSMESTNKLVEDASEARWVVDALQKIVNREAPQDIKSRAEGLMQALNERLMSTYPLLSTPIPVDQNTIWEELEAAGYTRSLALEQVDQQKKEEQPLKNEDDEMAETAGQLLERVADNTSEKFQNSQFLELMRRLRDREVRVEGDKMVEVSTPSSPSLPPSQKNEPQLQPPAPPVVGTAVPQVDPHILDHAATDFSMPGFSGEDEESI